MELRQLRYFAAIVDHGSLSRAALVLHAASGSVSLGLPHSISGALALPLLTAACAT